MKNSILRIVVLLICLVSVPAFSQADKEPKTIGLPGDNLDLYAVLDLFQKSKTIEDFEKSLNSDKAGINNLDLDLDKKVDFIKVVTKQDKEDFTFALQIAVSEKETQDVAVILLSKDKNKKVTLQIVGDKDLYGKNYIVEPKTPAPTSTANPGYTGAETVVVAAPTTTTVVIVESAPIVQYVYSPVYVPYYPPYHYAYYPPYYTAFAVVAVGVYHSNHYYNHYHGGGYGNTTVVVNHNTYNNYNNNSRNTSNTVNQNNVNGNYGGNTANKSTNAAKTNTANKPANTANTANKSANSANNAAASTKAQSAKSSSSAASSQNARASNSGTRSSGSRSFSGGGRRR
ncbi:hypothetical protein [Flavobacterium laiguense]|uniref:DUF3300 domain-containing protein n=1 Tax=Flavobacterium laiguense TaxID=2169409 RepID=A0A2U1JMI3_9FLAO|nr:hypothetical protein [Flavobacterium laiguense]PWA06352.1 hypothetical protein DB891_15725 [Flavobacterium laiguense]